LLNRKYIKKQAVDNIGFTIQPGEIVGLLGENGVGKTTTLKMLTGILYPSGGYVSVAGFTPTARKHAFLNLLNTQIKRLSLGEADCVCGVLAGGSCGHHVVFCGVVQLPNRFFYTACVLPHMECA